MAESKSTLTAIVIAKNEAARIGECLARLAWADELLVIDNGSTDDTVKIANKHGAKVISAIDNDFSKLRNLAKDKTKGNWLLYIDADELVTPELKQEIQKVINNTDEVAGYYLQRKNYYLGHPWPYSDKLVRLMRADRLKYWQGRLHETAIINGKIGIIHEPLIHNSHRTLEEMVNKTNEWSEIEAQLRYEAKHPKISWWRLIRVMFTGFINSFIAQDGWKAGTHGLIESIYQAFSLFITYSKLWELQQESQESRVKSKK